MVRTTNEVLIGQVWKRRVELHDDFDTVRICALVFNAGHRADEFIIRFATIDLVIRSRRRLRELWSIASWSNDEVDEDAKS